MKIAVLFDNLGPYHRARLEASTQVCDLMAVEFGSSSGEYAWHCEGQTVFRHKCINPAGRGDLLTLAEFKNRLFSTLDEFGPNAVAIPGWSKRGAFLAMNWAPSKKTPVVVMSDSTAWDHPRKALLELVKRRYCKGASAGFVAGSPHREYLMQLGLPGEKIVIGYDVVDNAFFERRITERRGKAADAAAQEELPKRYFLASARFIPKKNLPRLLEAYSHYLQSAKQGTQWDLILLGDGEQRPQVEESIRRHQLQHRVHLLGFKQYEDLPKYYAQAGGFVHASTTEQWGLVVNEAMASSLPVIVSRRCGCASDLVQEGINGFTFDPYDVKQLAEQMTKLASMDGSQVERMGDASRRIIAEWGPERFAKGLRQAAEIAVAEPRKQLGWSDRLLLGLLARKR